MDCSMLISWEQAHEKYVITVSARVATKHAQNVYITFVFLFSYCVQACHYEHSICKKKAAEQRRLPRSACLQIARRRTSSRHLHTGSKYRRSSSRHWCCVGFTHYYRSTQWLVELWRWLQRVGVCVICAKLHPSPIRMTAHSSLQLRCDHVYGTSAGRVVHNEWVNQAKSIKNSARQL